MEIKTLQRWIDMIKSAKGLAVIKEMREIIRGSKEGYIDTYYIPFSSMVMDYLQGLRRSGIKTYMIGEEPGR